MAGSGDIRAVADLTVRGAHCTVNGVRLHYLDFDTGGQGIPMLVLPGITSPAATWSFVARDLASDRRVVVADIRGRGLSDSRPGLGYGLDDYAADALGMIAAAGLRRPVILGHSMGARIGIRLAARNPSAVAALILADPPLTGPGRPPYPTPLSSYLRAHEAASRGATIESFRAFSPGWDDERVAARLEWLPTCSVEAIKATHAHFHSEDIHADLPMVACPTLLMRAAAAAVVTSEAAAEVMALLRVGTVDTVAAGHMIPWDNLPDFLRSIRSFLTDGSLDAPGSLLEDGAADITRGANAGPLPDTDK